MFPSAAVPALTCAEAKAWEASLLKNEEAEWMAMNRAGLELARAITDDFREIGGFPDGARILLLVGKGHNGGDALLAASALLEGNKSFVADVLMVFGETSLRPLARRAWEKLRRPGGERVRLCSLARLKTEMPGYALCLDGVFGFQFRAPMDERCGEVMAWTNTHPRIALRAAVDLPSGLGGSVEQAAFRADFTYATGIVKAPVLRPENAPWVGRPRYLDLGFFEVERVDLNALEHVLLPSILAPLTRLRPAQSDKRTYGHLFIVGGSLSYPGAVMLAVRAALRSGVGLLTAFVPESLVPEYAARQPEVMWVGCPVTAGGGLGERTAELIRERSERASALLIGPGLSADADTLVMVARLVRETRLPLVLDADALRPEIVSAALGQSMIVTPHAGELKRIESALAQAPHAVVVKKGPLTHIQHQQAKYWSLGGGPVLARGGSGDMLAGLIAGLLSQQPADPVLAACQGVMWHGRAADLLARAQGQRAVEVSQLLEQLGPALTSTTCQTH